MSTIILLYVLAIVLANFCLGVFRTIATILRILVYYFISVNGIMLSMALLGGYFLSRGAPVSIHQGFIKEQLWCVPVLGLLGWVYMRKKSLDKKAEALAEKERNIEEQKLRQEIDVIMNRGGSYEPNRNVGRNRIRPKHG